MEDSGIDSDPKPIINEDDTLFPGCSDSSCGSSESPPCTTSGVPQTAVVYSNNSSTNASTRQMQRKLEARIEQAKRMHRMQDYKKSPTPGLIPIQRLPIPGVREQQPLVDWNTDDSEEDIANFFPLTRPKENRQHQDLTDTFSIEELSVSGGEEDEDDLELVPPAPLHRHFDCCSVTGYKCVLM